MSHLVLSSPTHASLGAELSAIRSTGRFGDSVILSIIAMIAIGLESIEVLTGK